jgi:hypothetical protein
MRAAAVAVLSLTTLFSAGTSLSAQSLSSRPVLFADPVPGRPSPGRELELGATTIAAAKRIFAVELDEPVQVRRGSRGNPERLGHGYDWNVLGVTIRPAYRLDLGPDHYTLYFDANERLIGVLSNRLPRRVGRDEFMSRYPKATVDRRMHGGDIPFDYMVAPVGQCVALTATIQMKEKQVESLGYYYTCATRS